MKRSLCVLLPVLLSSASLAACLPLEPQKVTLEGKLTRQTVPGAPNFSDLKQGDRAERIWVLELRQPICVKATRGDAVNADVNGVRSIQLVTARVRGLEQGLYAIFRAKGTLFTAHTAHHRTPVLLDVERFELIYVR